MPLSLEKWDKPSVGPSQIILSLVINTNKISVGITNEYLQQVRELLSKWYPDQQLFKVQDMQKLIGKLACLGEGVPWIFKLMLHLYMSLAFALKTNAKLLTQGSSSFRELIQQIKSKIFSGKIPDHQQHINYALKKVAKMINGHLNLVNRTMCNKLLCCPKQCQWTLK
jgi:hypothetical protein